jgi:quercetin dioxygenase-like cupin family protein
MNPYLMIENLDAEVAIQQGGIVSKTLHNDDQLKVVLFGFDTGQELSEHTAATPAVIHFLKGEGRLTLGDDEKEAKPGVWAWMSPNLAHSIVADTPLVMLLMLLKK